MTPLMGDQHEAEPEYLTDELEYLTDAEVAELDAQFGTNSVPTYVYDSKLQRVPLQLIQDSGVDLESYLVRILADSDASALGL